MAKQAPGDGDPFAPGDVSVRSTTARSGNRGDGRSRASRAEDVSERRVTLTHTATGLSVHGAVPAGRYSRAELRLATDELREQLMAELVIKVRQSRRR
ncbi:hypothetical protein [Kineosporia sp. A_224]|uniref:hypothetical protein n=1 Tax=Kineosporia sp. A_224 TaxID=1962180 RepID=UPI001179A104|nr:hypothetical protein [Kineosporia sp. A_224]